MEGDPQHARRFAADLDARVANSVAAAAMVAAAS